MCAPERSSWKKADPEMKIKQGNQDKQSEGTGKFHQALLISDSDVPEVVGPLENCDIEVPK